LLPCEVIKKEGLLSQLTRPSDFPKFVTCHARIIAVLVNH